MHANPGIHGFWKQLQVANWNSAVFPSTQFLSQLPVDKERSQVLDKELGKLAAKQAIERVSDPAEACFISLMLLVSKSDGSWRPVINLKSLNQHTIERHFKMESIRTAKGLLHEGDFMVN